MKNLTIAFLILIADFNPNELKQSIIKCLTSHDWYVYTNSGIQHQHITIKGIFQFRSDTVYTLFNVNEVELRNVLVKDPYDKKRKVEPWDIEVINDEIFLTILNQNFKIIKDECLIRLEISNEDTRNKHFIKNDITEYILCEEPCFDEKELLRW